MKPKCKIKDFAEINKTFIVENYNNGYGTQWISKELGTHRQTIIRALKYLGVEMRTKSEAQLKNLERNGHPAEGKKLDENVKIKISESITKVNNNRTAAEKKKISEKAKENWDKRPDSEKDRFRKLGISAIRDTATAGSKLENYVYEGLIKNGYNCEQHKCVLQNKNLEVDILMTDMTVAIEIDGPSHIEPVWGQEALSKTIKADSEKNGQLVLNKYTVIRLQNPKKTTVNKTLRDGLQKILTILENIKSGKETRQIIIEKI